MKLFNALQMPKVFQQLLLSTTKACYLCAFLQWCSCTFVGPFSLWYGFASSGSTPCFLKRTLN
ncbi:hypothetical protein Tsubulata_049372, partial [Turnera subulata]